ncbi:MAG: hypothetical protein A2Z81_07610 [Omnitrophica WOR_2 bacterium GWA2_45_18]|nr:MAG: hypothetical protein A2Z81_07610 [Omnitrophica WOR_2 bacterium GWA2_45_18]
MKELIIYYSARLFGLVIQSLPLPVALWTGKFLGMMVYYVDARHKALAYANLKMAFSRLRSSDELKRITKILFQNYGRNLIELFRMPLLTPSKFAELVKIEGKENISEALKQGKGLILIAMHFGSWEMASVSCGLLDHPYKVIVKPQVKYSKLDELLNSYRACGGSVILSKGLGTRDFVKSLKNNEVIGMVVDQGGKDGVLVPFFSRQASMSSGAIRMGLKWGVPLCFSIIIRENGAHHRMIINKPLELENTGDMEKDVVTNLTKIAGIMERYITEYPSEYMWFYKIWKYSKEAHITLLSDGKTGHLRQSETVARMMQKALAERRIASTVQTVQVNFKNKFAARIFSLMSLLSRPFLHQGRLQCLKWFLTEKSLKDVMAAKADFIVSCGSSIAGVNHLLSQDHNAKSLVVLKPGLLGYDRFDLVLLPQHDVSRQDRSRKRVAVTVAAPNLVNEEYLKEQSVLLLNRFSHLKSHTRMKIGLFIGGNSKNVYLSEPQIRVLIHQIKQIAQEMNADILVTTSRRTPGHLEQLLHAELKKFPRCPLLILANKDNIPEAVGGILGLSDIVVVSGDSISMISEAAASGKDTIVFSPESRGGFWKGTDKHKVFIEKLYTQGFILSAEAGSVAQTINDVFKNKIHTKKIEDQQIILNAVREAI